VSSENNDCERWDKLKESVKRKKEAKVLVAVAATGAREKIVEELEAEELLDQAAVSTFTSTRSNVESAYDGFSEQRSSISRKPLEMHGTDKEFLRSGQEMLSYP
jgi:hypothetical protein